MARAVDVASVTGARLAQEIIQSGKFLKTAKVKTEEGHAVVKVCMGAGRPEVGRS